MNASDAQRTAVITGASSGIGREATKLLVQQGWRVIGVGRNPQRCAAAGEEIAKLAGSPQQVNMLCGDMALMSETRRIAAEIGALTDRVDLLLNNAGGLTRDLVVTEEGNENTFAGNHLAPFLLTQLLLPQLKRAAVDAEKGAVRIINMSSSAHEHCAGLDFDKLQAFENYNSNYVYCQAKLANILFTRELAKRLAGDNIIAHAMHPGLVASNFASHGDDDMQASFAQRADQTITPEMAAADLVWLANAKEAGQSSGDYYADRKPVEPSQFAQDAAAAEKLWSASELLVDNT